MVAQPDPQHLLFDYAERFRTLLTADAWTRLMMDLSRNDFLTLLLLHRRGEVRMSDVAEYLDAPLNTATGVVARLQRRGLVDRHHSPDDKRVVVVALSTDGADLVRRSLLDWTHFAGRVLSSLTAEQVDAVLTVLDRVLGVLAEDAAPAAPRTAPRRIPID
ncbi:MarR family transcriptional regulator [Propioniciclava sp.]|uniref:MarR family winged helix-turn-helix transcriptional regulator n=1 Tax=Propioniciclava sp. TaxID=2038686 RepID=UPI00262EE44D|nr:MarR family transcriptional regulator [Propioniciclava sp.]